MNEALIAVLAVVSVLLALAAAGTFSGSHHQELRTYFITRGERLLEVHWAPTYMGVGSWGWQPRRMWGYNDHNAWYRIRYIDRDGHEHSAVARTNGQLGVELFEDTIVRYVDEADHPSLAQEAENRLLREEEERLARKPKPEDPQA